MTRLVRFITTILDERLHERVMHNDLSVAEQTSLSEA